MSSDSVPRLADPPAPLATQEVPTMVAPPMVRSRTATVDRVFVPRVPGAPSPPTAAEKYSYLSAPQARWIFAVSALAFAGVAFSFAGLATRTYWTLALLAPLAIMVVEQAFALRTSTYRRRVTLPDHLATVELWEPRGAVPSVDVFLPNCGEDLTILANTMAHVSRLQWPGELTVYVLDDAGRPEVAELARNHGFEYIARPGSEFKKAGNLQYAYERSSGDHVLILDADFVPRWDMLHELVPYMDEPGTGIVQSPQYFRTDTSLGWLERSAGATQELFFRHIQPSRDAVGAAICVGTSALYRRAALDAIGGFPLIGHSEDVFTGVFMSREGYSLQYVPVLLSRGECPSDMDSFIAQQYRWCEGSMALVASERFHEDRRMSVPQRVSFWAGFLYYVSTALMAVLAPVPLLVMLFAFPDQVSAINLLPLVGVLVLWFVVFPVVSKARWRIEVLRVQAVYGFAHLFCIWDMLHGRTTEWVPTGAGARKRPRIATRVKSFMVPYLVLSQGAIVAGLVIGTWTYGVGAFWATILFAAVGFYVYVPVVAVAIWPGLDRRKARPVVVPAQRTAWEALVHGRMRARRRRPQVRPWTAVERHARA